MKRVINKIKHFIQERKLQSFEQHLTKKRQRGAITLAMLVALVPLLSFSLFFADLNRFQLVQGIVASAEDLALNGALANFDGPLLDHTGLMGSAKKVQAGSIKDSAEKAFEKSVNLSFGDNTGVLSGKMFGSTDGGTKSLLGVDVVDVSVDPVAGANLGNPAILHAQIVDFMKFRAPINVAEMLYEKFKASGDHAKKAKGNSELMQGQKNTMEAAEKIYDALKNMYKNVKKYEELALTEERVKEMVEALNPEISDKEAARKNMGKTFKEKYFYIHNQRFERWESHKVQGLINQLGTLIDPSFYADLWDIDEYAYPDNFYKGDNYSASDVEDALRDVASVFQNIELKRYRMLALLANFGITRKYNEDKDSKTKFAFVGAETIGISGLLKDYTDLLQDFVKKFRKFEYIADHLDDTDPTENLPDGYDDPSSPNYVFSDDRPKSEGDKEFSITIKGAQEFNFSNILKGTNNILSAYIYPTSKMTVSEHVAQSKSSLWNYIWNNRIRGTNELVKDVSNAMKSELTNKNKYKMSDFEDATIQNINKTITEFNDDIKEAKPALNNVVKERDKLEKAMKDFLRERDEWKAKVEAYDGSDQADQELVDEHKAALGIVENEDGKKLEDMITKLTPEVMDQFFEHLSNLKDSYNTLEKFIEGVKYGSKKLIKIKKGSTFKDAVKVAKKDMPEWGTKDFYSLEKLHKVADHYFFPNGKETKGVYYSPDGYKNIHFDEAHNSHPDLNKPQNILYDVIMEYGHSVIENGNITQEKEDTWDKIKDIVKKISFAIIPNELDIKSFTNNEAKEDAYDQGSMAVAPLAKTANLGVVSSMRDSLYILDYISSMFTSDTTRQEAVAKYANADNITAAIKAREQHLSHYETDRNKRNTWNKDLRNHVFSSETHFALGNEIEYINFGHENNLASKAHSYGLLFGVRTAMNAFPVIRYAGSISTPLGAFIDFLSTIVGAWIPFGIGKVIVKTLMVFFCVMLETYLDVLTLKAGLSAPFYKKPSKTGEDLLMLDILGDLFSFGGESADIDKSKLDPKAIESKNIKVKKSKGGKTVEDPDGKQVNVNDWYYSTYMNVYLFIMLQFDGAEQDVLSRVSNVIEKNMLSITGENYNLQKMNTYYQIKGNVKTKSIFNINLGDGNWGQLNPWTISFGQVKGY